MASVRIETFNSLNKTLYAIVRGPTGLPLIQATPAWDTAFTAASYGTYDVPLAEQVDGANRTGYYYVVQDLPVTVAGACTFEIKEQVAGSPALNDPRVDIGRFMWYGNLGEDADRAIMAFAFGKAARSGDIMTFKDIWTDAGIVELTMDPTVKGVRTAITLL